MTHLDGLSEIVSTPLYDSALQQIEYMRVALSMHLLFDNLAVDLAGCNIVIARQGYVEIALIVSEVKVNLSAIVQDIDFACKPRV